MLTIVTMEPTTRTMDYPNSAGAARDEARNRAIGRRGNGWGDCNWSSIGGLNASMATSVLYGAARRG